MSGCSRPEIEVAVCGKSVDKTERKVLQVFRLEVESSRSRKREIAFQMQGKKLTQLVAGAMLPPPDEVFVSSTFIFLVLRFKCKLFKIPRAQSPTKQQD